MPGIYKKGAYEFQYGLGLMSRGRGIYRGLYASSVQRYGLTDRVTASGSLALWPEGAILGAGAQHAWRGKTMINATAATRVPAPPDWACKSKPIYRPPLDQKPSTGARN